MAEPQPRHPGAGAGAQEREGVAPGAGKAEYGLGRVGEINHPTPVGMSQPVEQPQQSRGEVLGVVDQNVGI